MGNSSLSVEQILGSFNFAMHKDEDGIEVYFRASVGLKKFAILHHAHGRRPPTKYNDPITVSLFETQGNVHYRTWMRSYESVTYFLGVIHRCTPWNVSTCEATGCNNKPALDASRCEKHME